MLFICYSRCTTCKKAQQWLDDQGANYTRREIKDEPPTEAELRAWQKASGLPLGRFWNTSGQQYRALGLKDEFVVGFVGGLIKRKGFGTLQRVIARHPDWKAILIGKGAEEPLTLSASQQAFVGRVEHTEIPRYLSAADVFALPTLAEGCCNAIVEALACGLPVVSSDRSFNDDLLTDDCSLRVDPTDESALERALVELSESGNKRASFAQAAFARAQNFSIENRAKNIVNFMERNS